MNFQKLAIALDRSPQATSVFAQALAIAQSFDAQVRLLHCLSVDAFADASLGCGATLDLPMMVWEKQHAHLQQEAEAVKGWLSEYQQRSVQAGVAAEVVCGVGQPGVWICQQASEWHADMIILGRRGYRGVREIVFGSVSSHVLHNAACSVLVVQGADACADPVQEAATVASAASAPGSR